MEDDSAEVLMGEHQGSEPLDSGRYHFTENDYFPEKEIDTLPSTDPYNSLEQNNFIHLKKKY